jgi:hypothetical protein
MGTTLTTTVLRSNAEPIPFTDEYFTPLRDSAGLLARPGELRERLHADGCLLVRGLLGRSEVLDLREAYFTLFGPGLLASGTTPRDGIFSGQIPPGLPPYGTEGHPAHSFVRGDTFRRFLDHPALHSLSEALLGGRTRLLPRCVFRHFVRGSGLASRAHVDYDYMDKGTERVLTMWIPVGDCPLPTGGLIYLEGSHALGSGECARLRDTSDRPGDRRPISHDLALTGRVLGRRWMWADYAAGDVVVHLPRIIHASLDTLTDTMRLSVDARFIPDGDVADPRWLKPWAADDGA